jgi:hypothetical protein
MLKKDTFRMLRELMPLDVHIFIMGKISIVISYATAEAIDLSIKVIKNQTQSRSSDKTKIDSD